MNAETTSRRQRDKPLTAELMRIRAAYPHVVGDLALERVAHRLAVLSIALRELRQEVKAQGGAGKADVKRLTEMRQHAAECAAHEAQLRRAALNDAPREDAMSLMLATRNALVARAKAREEERKKLAIEGQVAVPTEKPFSAAALIRQQRDGETTP